MKNFFKHIYIIGRIPQIDWLRIFFVSILLAIFVSGYGYVYYGRITSVQLDTISTYKPPVVNATSSSQSVDQNPYDKNGNGNLELQEVIEMYKDRKDNYEKLLNSFKR